MSTSKVDILRNYVEAVASNIDGNKLPDEIDLVFGSGAFNGGSAIGAAIFIKELEKQGKLKVRRLSGSSIGSLVALAYITDKFEYVEQMHSDGRKMIRDTGSFEGIHDIFSQLVDTVSDNNIEKLIENISDRLFISYNNASNFSYHVVSSYSTKADLVNALERSCYMPLITDGDVCIHEKYFDGIIPHLFNDSKIPVLVITLSHISQLAKIASIRGEENPHARVLSGVTDASTFFLTGQSILCSWRNKWGYRDYAFHYMFYYCIAIVCVVIYYLKSTSLLKPLRESQISCIVTHVTSLLFRDMLKIYCV
jgi:hypothetical protein